MTELGIFSEQEYTETLDKCIEELRIALERHIHSNVKRIDNLWLFNVLSNFNACAMMDLAVNQNWSSKILHDAHDEVFNMASDVMFKNGWVKDDDKH